MACQVRRYKHLGTTAVALQNECLAFSILPARGAEVISLTHLSSGIDVLWKAPWRVKPWRTGDTEIAWMDSYAGGWQDIFPNGGDPCMHSGTLLGFHGEASTASWDVVRTEKQEAGVSIVLNTELARSPFFLEKTLTLKAGSSSLTVDLLIENRSDEESAFMWGQHPAYGAPFLGEHTRLIIPAGSIYCDKTGEKMTWCGTIPLVEPGRAISDMRYLAKLTEGWYRIENHQLGFGLKWNWDARLFPYVWLWRELFGSKGYPFYGRCFVVGVEPFTSIPGHGLKQCLQNGTAKFLPERAKLVTRFTLEFYDLPLALQDEFHSTEPAKRLDR